MKCKIAKQFSIKTNKGFILLTIVAVIDLPLTVNTTKLVQAYLRRKTITSVVRNASFPNRLTVLGNQWPGDRARDIQLKKSACLGY
jgi:hypothetical protein